MSETPTLANDTSSGVRALVWLTTAVLLVPFALLLYTLVHRVGYPFELEWMEGGMWEHLRRLARGESLYVAPSLQFTPYIYNPLFAWLGALVAGTHEDGLQLARGISVLATACTLGLLAAWTWTQTRTALAALLSASLYAGAFQVTGAWYDLARVDSLYVFLLLAAAYGLHRARSPLGLVFAALLGWLAFMSKQTALLSLSPLLLWTFWRWRWQGLWLALPCLALIGSSVFVLSTTSGGWYEFYAFKLPSTHPILPRMFVTFWWHYLVRPFIPAAAILLLGLQQAKQRTSTCEFGFAMCLGLGFWAGSFSMSVHDGGYHNSSMAFVAAIALLSGWGLPTLLERWSAAPMHGARRLALVAFFQVLLLSYDPRPLIPSPGSAEAGWTMVNRLASLKGEILVQTHQSLAIRAQALPSAHDVAINDVKRSAFPQATEAIEKSLKEGFESKRFAGVVALAPTAYPEYPEFQKNYVAEPISWSNELDLRCVSGMAYRPGGFFLPR